MAWSRRGMLYYNYVSVNGAQSESRRLKHTDDVQCTPMARQIYSSSSPASSSSDLGFLAAFFLGAEEWLFFSAFGLPLLGLSSESAQRAATYHQHTWFNQRRLHVRTNRGNMKNN
jgi:hypothetical protein